MNRIELAVTWIVSLHGDAEHWTATLEAMFDELDGDFDSKTPNPYGRGATA